MRIGGFNKYRNSVATVSGREAWYSELILDTSTSIACDGLGIDDQHLYVKTASGNSLQALSIDSPGKLGPQTVALESPLGRIAAWSAAPHDTSMVCAADDQGVVSVWKDCSPMLTVKAHAAACSSVKFHPTVAGVLATAATVSTASKSSEVRLWNVSASTESAFWETSVDGIVDSVAIRGDGQLISAITHDGICQIYDPRQHASSAASSVGRTAAIYAPGRPTRVLWLGEKPYMLTTGLTRMRERSAALWDQRNLAKPLASISLQPSTKPLIPLYDEDTQLAYLAEKGDNAIRWVDADPSSAKPLAELGTVVLQSQVSGCALLPKRALRVMSGEIARVHVVTENSGAGTGAAIIPISHVAPRRTYLDFHADLYPDTRAPLPAQSFDQWIAQQPASVPRMALDPAKSEASLASLRQIYAAALGQVNKEAAPSPVERDVSQNSPLVAKLSAAEALSSEPKPKTVATSTSEAIPTPEPTPVTPATTLPPKPQAKPSVPASEGSKVFALKTGQATPKKQWQPVQKDYARFKYLEGYIHRPSSHYTNISNVNLRFSQENEPIKVSPKFIAVACDGAGGQVGIIRRDSPGRVPTKLPTIVHGSSVVSMEFDPFDPNVVATAGSDGKLQMWHIPDTELSEETSFDLVEYICVTADRIHQIRFHPWAKGVVAVLVTDADEQAIFVYHGLKLHFIVGKTTDGIHSFAWSPDGECIALTTKKSRQLQIYDPRTQDLLAKGPSMDSIRPCRIAWIDSSRICLAGFGSGSQRQIKVYNVDDLAKPTATATIDVGPGLLVPIVDADCGIIYLDDRGSRLTHPFELVGDKLFALPKLEAAQPGLGLAVVPKKYADIGHCEVGLFYRLNAQSVEPIGFRVPRKRPEYFQDDIFIDTYDTETPSVDVVAWIDGVKAAPLMASLCPPGMTPLSQAPPETIRRRTFEAKVEKPVDNTKDAINAMLRRVESSDDGASDGRNGSGANDDENSSGSDWDD
ncbi:hypothetical protein LPJ53_001450 [Coemansia erecta]|uniref:Coronin n=1 Tax=Coemansia erecta TaxID=147472 RepID=A0A9W7Y5F2_9FUNG|nr:hypothetical protein LPJ53_001450 [Coemansia erecta]